MTIAPSCAPTATKCACCFRPENLQPNFLSPSLFKVIQTWFNSESGMEFDQPESLSLDMWLSLFVVTLSRSPFFDVIF
jgi:hypothetical protein